MISKKHINFIHSITCLFQDNDEANGTIVQPHNFDPPWMNTAMNFYKVFWVFNSSVNYYLYKIKMFISKGKLNFGCTRNCRESQEGDIELQESVRTRSSRLDSH